MRSIAAPNSNKAMKAIMISMIFMCCRSDPPIARVLNFVSVQGACTFHEVDLKKEETLFSMNPFMATSTHSRQIAQPFSADAFVGFVVYLRRAAVSTLSTFVTRTFEDRPAFALPFS